MWRPNLRFGLLNLGFGHPTQDLDVQIWEFGHLNIRFGHPKSWRGRPNPRCGCLNPDVHVQLLDIEVQNPDLDIQILDLAVRHPIKLILINTPHSYRPTAGSTAVGICCTATAPAAQTPYLLHRHGICCTGLLHKHCICFTSTAIAAHTKNSETELSDTGWSTKRDITILPWGGVRGQGNLPWLGHRLATRSSCWVLDLDAQKHDLDVQIQDSDVQIQDVDAQI